MLNKSSIILRYFQKSDQLTVDDKQYQQSISSLFRWLTDNDKVEADKTAKYFPNKNTEAIIMAKQDGIIAGLEEVEYLLEKYTKLEFKPKTKDGSGINNEETIAEIKGSSNEILAYERTILNILQRTSGIATETNHLIKLIGPKPYLAATRKTPMMNLDKKAVAVGGGLTHRLNLSDGILIKDNHLKLDSIENILQILMGKYQNELIEIEVTDTKQAFQTIATFNRINTNNHLAILLDNFTLPDAKKTIAKLQKEFYLTSIIYEGSGGINEENIKEWTQTGVDLVSLGSLTHSSKALNISLEF